MKKLFLATFLTVGLLGGCATTSGLEAKSSVSSFDGTKSVAIAPHGVMCSDIATCLNTGFVWQDDSVNEANMLVQVVQSVGGDYHPISSVKFNIDGEIIDVKPHAGGSNEMNHEIIGTYVTTTTDRLYVTPLSLLERIKASNNTKIQVISKGAVFEGDFKNSGESTKAYYAMLRFLEQVEANK